MVFKDGYIAISPGNILGDSTGCAKLGDLEYAERVDDENSLEFLVGTRKFMTVEVDPQTYRLRLFLLPLPATFRRHQKRIFDYVLNSAQMSNSGPKVPFRYKHDSLSLYGDWPLQSGQIGKTIPGLDNPTTRFWM
ncbi:hypothetical protein PHLCEN_2v2026 [Hermanssonia centrifuga]|uniref:Uncharacterized protein n=1 Tax=Hermanssonia centrifuga TaxID=98765 RepID=A0A2R6RQB3_9APHY|nr:hypothetical protein PHLCEN_2v2026 [Hermanssonia centrifuga]